MSDQEGHRDRPFALACFVLALILSSVALLLVNPAGAGEADQFPSKALEVVIHAGVGGGTDRNARALLAPLTDILDADAAFISKKGAAGAVAMQYVNARPADGYTFTVITTAHATAIARGRSAMSLDDFIYLGRGTSEPQVFYTTCGRFASAVAFVEHQKENALSYGITNVGGIDDITALWFAKAGGLQSPLAVPFKSGGEIVTNLIAGNIDVGVLNPGEALAQVDAGQLCPVIVNADERFIVYPDTPTARELGVNSSFSVMRGFAIKRGAPDAVVERLKAAVAQALASDPYRGFLAQNDLDYETNVGSAEAFEREFKGLVTDMGAAMKALGYIE